MEPLDDEDRLLRSVALQNARSILLARQRAEEELVRTKETLRQQTEWLRVTLGSIGDAVVTTDTEGRVLSLNGVAQDLTGWPQEEAQGRPLAEVFRIVNEQSRETVENPVERALREGRTVGLANHTLLLARDGTEIPIDDSAAPIRDDQGQVYGVVLIFRDITERKKAEDALLLREQELADFFENASVGLHWVGPDGTILRVNRAELELLGYSREEYLGHPIAEFHVDKEVIADILRRLAAGEVLRDREARLRSKDGSIKHVLIDSSVRWQDDRFVHTRCFTRDVTDHRQAAEAQARLAAIVESSEDAIVGKTLDSTILSWNTAAERLFGYTAEEAVGRSITILIPAERQDEEDFIMERLRRGERIEHYETVRIAKDGRLLDVSLTISPIRDRSGRIVGAAKIARDVTARRWAEQATRFLADASAALAELTDYRSTLQKVGDLAVPLFADWCAVDVLEADGSIRRLALTHGDAAQRRLADELRARYPPQPGDSDSPMRALRTGEPEWRQSIPDSLLEEAARDGDHLALLRQLGLRCSLSVPLRSRTRTLGVLTCAMAGSGRTYSASDLAIVEDLAHRAVIAIENASLLATLKEADSRKDEFLAMLAHELRNPLAPIRNAVQIFRVKAPATPELRWATEVIERQVHQMTRLVDDLLDVSRITRGKIELRKERVELAAVIDSAVEASGPLIEKWGHELTVEVPPLPIHVEADPTRLAQVVSNLLNNAAKYTDQGGSIWLTAEQKDGDALIRVRDTGAGIPPEMLQRIFDMFTQVDHTLERSEGGLGIGLTLVQQLVEMHGGAVEARSAGLGQGSEFIVRLPVAREAEQARTAAGETLLVPAPRRILVVDDNRDAADSLGMLLRMIGNEVHTAYDGLEAVGAAATFQPDVIVLDIGLPKLNGYEAARQIRAQPGGADRVLIALTGWGQEEDRLRSKEAGFDHHITKPVELSTLKKLLAQVAASAAG
jgi:PAS domain S-box-containing protein